jgi:Spy/CpxP family protein refolding chaperone
MFKGGLSPSNSLRAVRAALGAGVLALAMASVAQAADPNDQPVTVPQGQQGAQPGAQGQRPAQPGAQQGQFGAQQGNKPSQQGQPGVQQGNKPAQGQQGGVNKPTQGQQGGVSGQKPSTEAQTYDEFRDRIQTAVDDFYDKAEVTEEQRAEIAPIIDKLTTRLWSLRADRLEARDEFRRALTEERMDRGHFDRARHKSMDVWEDASKAMFDAIEDVAKVLNPEQRAMLVDQLEQMHQ